MPLYEGSLFDDYAAPVEAAGKTAPPKSEAEIAAQLETDIAHFQQGNQILIDSLELDADRPTDKIFETNIGIQPINWVGMQYLALRQKGYDVSFSSTAYDSSGRVLNEYVSVFISSADKFSTPIPNSYYMERLSPDESVQELSSLLALLTEASNGTIESYHLNLTDKDFDSTFSKLSSLPNREQLIAGGFLTSHVVRNIYKYSRFPFIDNANDAAYNRLTGQKVKPLRPEQMMGIATAAVSEWIRLNPDYPEPTNQPQRPY